ncbi:MAG: carbamoyl-phosphate synthase small subunit [Candidatus Saganbacteria bacterium]|uniref:Carbamoyl phosphate synthase small chain n=1 Tax=Candidatus Saganbacteria bacterium TaxID=2575572 RepID=A0A833NYP8_UNCSA|nr:MAG: carbamoyl-phosphate synthase small subunit [Candidatus Saganbacteria bacterium]
MKAYLALEDGVVFEGKAFGCKGLSEGEIVFNTSMAGYQEILTDPSYKGQIICMTYPLIGNYGINTEDFESLRPHCSGFVVKELSGVASNWRAGGTLSSFLNKHKIIGIEGIDTRALTKHIRDQGAMKAVISTTITNKTKLIKMAKDSLGLVGRDLVKEVTCKKAYEFNKSGKYKVAVIDCGAKYNIMRELAKRNCKVRVFPANSSAKDILSSKPDGLMLSNGPGDPAAVTYVCLGHQMLGLALGGKTYKLKFGHRGANQPVMNLSNRKVEITSQNHGFCVDIDSIDKDKVEITHINLNDKTLEGFRHKKYPVFCVQYHPEASPGPNDSKYLFDEFIKLMKGSHA